MLILPNNLIQRMRRLRVSEDDLSEKFSRSGGAGGQNVNKVNTRVQLSYTHPEFGVFNISSQKERDQEKNRIAARERLCERIEESIQAKKLAASEMRYQERARTRKPSKKAKARKRDEKTHQSRKKANRRVRSDD